MIVISTIKGVKKLKKTWAIAASAALSLTLAGCGANDDTAMNNKNNNQGQGFNTEQVRTRNVNNLNNVNNNQTNGRKLSVSDRAELEVERMNEVEEANVIIWNNNAYVAVRLANQNRTGNMQPGDNTANVNNRNNNENTEDRVINNGGNLLDNGVVNQSDNRKGNNGIIDGQGDAGRGSQQNTGTATGGNNNNLGVNNNNNNERSGANTDHQTTDYASDWNNYSPVSNAFEQRIADRVRQVESKIHNVYVSNNPALYGQMTNYADDIRNNGSREGILDDFNNTVNNFFRRGND